MDIKSLLILFLLSISIAHADWFSDSKPSTQPTIKSVENFNLLFKKAKQNNKIIMLEMSATYCGYCRTLEEEIIQPMLLSGDYHHVIIRQLHIDDYYELAMPDNKKMTPGQYAQSKNVYVTPTLLFLNSDNEEVSERIVGINSVDYFGAYVDDAIDQGTRTLQ